MKLKNYRNLILLIMGIFSLTIANRLSPAQPSHKSDLLGAIVKKYKSVTFKNDTVTINTSFSKTLRGISGGIGLLCIEAGICGVTVQKNKETKIAAAIVTTLGTLLSGGVLYIASLSKSPYLTINSEGMRLKERPLITWNNIREVQITERKSDSGFSIGDRLSIIDTSFQEVITALSGWIEVPISDIVQIIHQYRQEASTKK